MSVDQVGYVGTCLAVVMIVLSIYHTYIFVGEGGSVIDINCKQIGVLFYLLDKQKLHWT